jgi:hypothetical protein
MIFWHESEVTSLGKVSNINHIYIYYITTPQTPFSDGMNPPEMPNPLGNIAKGEDLFVVMLPLWCNDVSSNRSKQYNKHINMYMANSCVPGRLLQQEYFVRYVSASPHATAPEQFSVLREEIKYVTLFLNNCHEAKANFLIHSKTQEEPIRCYNADTHRNCGVILRCPGLPVDNPQQSEESSHMGGNANCSCRKCKVGGNHKYTESDEGYHSLHFVSYCFTIKFH